MVVSRRAVLLQGGVVMSTTLNPIPVPTTPVSYTHLTLPTILRV